MHFIHESLWHETRRVVCISQRVTSTSDTWMWNIEHSYPVTDALLSSCVITVQDGVDDHLFSIWRKKTLYFYFLHILKRLPLKKKASYITCFNLLKMTCWGVTVWVNRYLSLKIWCFCHLFLIQCLVSGLKFSLKPHQPPLSSAVQFTAGFKLLLNLLFKQLQQFLPLGPQETQCSIIKLSPKSITMHTTDPISK